MIVTFKELYSFTGKIQRMTEIGQYSVSATHQVILNSFKQHCVRQADLFRRVFP